MVKIALSVPSEPGHVALGFTERLRQLGIVEGRTGQWPEGVLDLDGVG